MSAADNFMRSVYLTRVVSASRCAVEIVCGMLRSVSAVNELYLVKSAIRPVVRIMKSEVNSRRIGLSVN